MLNAGEVVQNYYLETRCLLLEIAATLDRLDLAAHREPEFDPHEDPQVQQIYRSLSLLASADTSPDRVERLLNLFSDLD